MEEIKVVIATIGGLVYIVPMRRSSLIQLKNELEHGKDQWSTFYTMDKETPVEVKIRLAHISYIVSETN